MTSAPDNPVVAVVEQSLAPFDGVSTPVEVHEALADVVQGLTGARATAVCTSNSGAVHVAAVTGDAALEPGQGVAPIDALVDSLAERTGAPRSAAGGFPDTAGEGGVDVWPVLALRRAVAAVVVIEAGSRTNDGAVAAVCRYAGLRLSQMYDAELREDQLHERGAAIKSLRRLADTDALTGVSNRSGLFAVLNSLLGRGEPVGIVYLDLDGFKDVNDTYGHATGDRVLAAVATRLRRVARAPDLVARLGGDEFVLVVRDGDERGLARLVERVTEALSEPITIEDVPIRVGASCGTAYAGHGGTIAELLAAADSRMYDGKRESRSDGRRRVIDLDAHR